MPFGIPAEDFHGGFGLPDLSEEAKSTYYNVQHQFDKEYIVGNLIELFNDDGSYDDMLEKLRSNPELLSRVAYRYRKNIEELYSADHEFDCLRNAYIYCTDWGFED